MPSQVRAAGAGASSSPGPGNDAIGAWVNPGNIVSDNGSYATGTNTTGSILRDDGAQLIVGGVAAGSDLHTGTSLANNTNDQTYTYGSSSTLWGLTPTYGEINSSNFGFRFAAESTGGSGTHWLNASSFGFSLPPCTIDGIIVRVQWGQSATSGQRSVRVDYIECEVFYTPTPADIFVFDWDTLATISDGETTPIDYGSVDQGDPAVLKSFGVQNTGGENLVISSVTVPTGYTVDGTSAIPASGTTITPLSIGELVVRLDTAVAGTKSGDITINSNAPSARDVFTFAITGEVVAAGGGGNLASGLSLLGVGA